ncbi:TetR/AcrR family transcriptional regulator [Aquibacillus sp. 3ASR75-11]|uniref:TetR/AcrR family transcriptional regulator n=1 Tax=Terrihalobacillus insolitus TaxID=2950438 RepID=A0A9X4AP02_9BACI|nr:TetR/AcrR family transcriptional regulator [Terrihalobacillus insolitus]MDC3414950.1 TetR/AcrR family transcriptional regulator [Terrihalobacillus insolitus]MDC3425063.1 TetR/AcrR family transcriptional regulator [Terrihalobacillus insolitus]
MPNKKVASSVKDQELIQLRRDQMIKGAVTLFIEKGFHRTTTREIAKASGFSIGTLYEYIRTKEDVLFLVVDSIYMRVKERMEALFDTETASISSLVDAVRSYFQLVDDMQDEVMVMYQEVKSLPKDAKEYVLQKEKGMVAMLERVIANSLPYTLSKEDVSLLANNIFVQGQMWSFRRWMLQKEFTLDTYIDRQVHYFLKSVQEVGNLQA